MFEKYPDIVTVDHLTEMLHIGKSAAYEIVKTNQIPHLRIGKKYIIPKQSVIGFINTGCYNDSQIMSYGLPTLKGDVAI